MRIDEIDVIVRGQRDFHLGHRFLAEPVGHRVVDDVDAREGGERLLHLGQVDEVRGDDVVAEAMQVRRELHEEGPFGYDGYDS